MSSPEELLAEIAERISKELERRREVVRKILANLEVDETDYEKLMIMEVVGDISIVAQFAFPPHRNHSPEEVKSKALKIFYRKLKRDKRLYLM